MQPFGVLLQDFSEQVNTGSPGQHRPSDAQIVPAGQPWLQHGWVLQGSTPFAQSHPATQPWAS